MGSTSDQRGGDSVSPTKNPQHFSTSRAPLGELRRRGLPLMLGAKGSAKTLPLVPEIFNFTYQSRRGWLTPKRFGSLEFVG